MKIERFLIFIALLFAAFVLLCKLAFASQYNPVLSTTSPYPGLTMLSNANSSFATLLSNNSGASAPTYQVEGTFFINTSSSLLEVYSGTGWVNAGAFSASQWQSVNNGVPYTIPASTGSANAYVVTYAPVPTALVTGQHYPFISNFANTTTATENVNGLGAKQITKQGTAALASADIPSGAVVDTVYDGTFMQMVSQRGNSSSGTLTSIATNNGVTGGTITGAGTIGLAPQSNNTILSNISGATAAPTGNSVSGVMDSTTTNTQGGVYYRNATGFALLPPGTSGQPLVTQGASANPVFGSNVTISGAFTGGSAAISGTTTTANLVITGSCTGCSATPSAFAVGSYVLACYANGANCVTNSVGAISAGTTVAGSTLEVFTAGGVPTGDSVTGTWRAMQTATGTGGTQPTQVIILFLRIS